MWGTGSGKISKVAIAVQLFTAIEIIISTSLPWNVRLSWHRAKSDGFRMRWFGWFCVGSVGLTWHGVGSVGLAWHGVESLGFSYALVWLVLY